jgi:hypothetical protein
MTHMPLFVSELCSHLRKIYPFYTILDEEDLYMKLASFKTVKMIKDSINLSSTLLELNINFLSILAISNGKSQKLQSCRPHRVLQVSYNNHLHPR